VAGDLGDPASGEPVPDRHTDLRLDSPASRPNGGGHDGGLREWRAARGDGAGNDGGLRDRRADDADPAYTCWS
jgi:hypothetical protein